VFWTIINEHNSAQSYLRWRQENPKGTVDEVTRDMLTQAQRKKPNDIAFVSDEDVKTEAELQLKELERGFWVNLSQGSLIGLCMLAGLGGAAGGFGSVWIFYCLIWLVYLFIRWLVMAFYDVSQKC